MSGKKDKRKVGEQPETPPENPQEKKSKPNEEGHLLFGNIITSLENLRISPIGGGCHSSRAVTDEEIEDYVLRTNEQDESVMAHGSENRLKTLEQLLALDKPLPPLQLESSRVNSPFHDFKTHVALYVAYCAGMLSQQQMTQDIVGHLTELANKYANEFLSFGATTLSKASIKIIQTTLKVIIPFIGKIVQSYGQQGAGAVIEMASGNIAPITLFIIETYLVVRFTGLDIHILPFARRFSNKIAEGTKQRLSEMMTEVTKETKEVCSIAAKAPRKVVGTLFARTKEIYNIFFRLTREAIIIAKDMVTPPDDESTIMSTLSEASLDSAVTIRDTTEELLSLVETVEKQEEQGKDESEIEATFDKGIKDIAEELHHTESGKMDTEPPSQVEVNKIDVSQLSLPSPFQSPENSQEDSQRPATQDLPGSTISSLEEESKLGGNKKHNKTNKHKKKSKNSKFTKHIRRTKHKRSHNKLRKTLRHKH